MLGLFFLNIFKDSPHHLLLTELIWWQPLANTGIKQVPTSRWHLPSTSTRIKSCGTAAADLQHSLKEFRAEMRNKALCSGKNWQKTVLYVVRHLQEKILRAQFLHLSISRKALKYFMVKSAFYDKQQPSAKNMCLIACLIPPSPEPHVYWTTCPTPTHTVPIFGATSQSCLPGYSPHFVPNKT